MDLRLFLVLLAVPASAAEGPSVCPAGYASAGERIAASERTPHQNFIVQTTMLNQHYPQMNAAIRMQSLAFVLKSRPMPIREILQPITDEDVRVLGEAMDRVHKAMGVPNRTIPTAKAMREAAKAAGQDTNVVNVTSNRLQNLLGGNSASTARNLVSTLRFLDPKARLIRAEQLRLHDIMDIEGRVVESLDTYLAEHPHLPEEPPDAFAMIKMLRKVASEQFAKDFPEHDRREWELWFNETHFARYEVN
jgi:hypothetical protein